MKCGVTHRVVPRQVLPSWSYLPGCRGRGVVWPPQHEVHVFPLMAAEATTRVSLLLVLCAAAMCGGFAVTARPCLHSRGRASQPTSQMQPPPWGDPADDDPAAAPMPAAGEVPSRQWDDAGFDEDGNFAEGVRASSETSLATAAEPPREMKPIETVKLGLVSGPYKRRNGWYVEVAVQHPGAGESMHRLWFGHEVLRDVARLKNCQKEQLDVELFAEAVVRFLQEEGVALADPDWGMDDDLIPFSVEHLPLRTLFSYYEQLPQYLADALLSDVVYSPATDDAEPEDVTRELDEAPKPGMCLGAMHVLEQVALGAMPEIPSVHKAVVPSDGQPASAALPDGAALPDSGADA